MYTHDQLARGFRTFVYAAGYHAIYESFPSVESLKANNPENPYAAAIAWLRNYGIPNNCQTAAERFLELSHMTPLPGDTIPSIISRFETTYNTIEPHLRIETMNPAAYQTVTAALLEAHSRIQTFQAALLLNATGSRDFAVEVLSDITE